MSGRYRYRPVFQTATRSQDPSSGAEIELWPPDGGTTLTLPADFQFLGTSEFPMREKLYDQTTVRFIVRWSPEAAAIDAATYRIVHDGHTWNITGARPDSRHTEITIEANELK